MRCESSGTATMSWAGPEESEDQLTRLVSVYRSAGLTSQAAHQAASADLDALQPANAKGACAGQPSFWLVLAAFAAIYLIWGSTFLAIRYAVASLPPFLMAGARFGVAGLLLFVVARLLGAQLPSRRQWFDAGIIGTCMLVVGNGGVTWAEQVIPSGVTALIIALIPLWLVIFDWLRPAGVRPRPLVFVGLAVGFVGVALLVGGGAKYVTGAYGWGVAALVVASMSWAIGSLISRRARKPSSPLMAVAIQMIAGGVITVGLGLATGEAGQFSLERVTALSAWSWLYLCLAGSLVGYTAYVWLLQVSTPARVSTYAYVNPLIAVLLGCTIGREPFSQQLLLAACLIVAAVGLIVRGGSKPSLGKEPAVLVGTNES